VSREPFPCPDYEGDEPATPAPAVRTKPVLDAIRTMIHAFRRFDMPPPRVIEITAEEGRQLMSEVDGYLVHPSKPPERPHLVTADLPLSCYAVDLPYSQAKAVLEIADEHTAQTFMQAEVMGVKVRWPATAMARFKGGSILY
jgi:hypothetical protein